ncbi:MAG: hypothetical protein ACXADO_03550 [Candidatus Thorarchaeota archaeon]|jgi:hypothetical protein
MQSSDVHLLIGVRLLLLAMLLSMVYYSTRRSSRAYFDAWRLPIVYPYDRTDSKREIKDRETLLLKLSNEWSLFTVIDFILGVLIVYEMTVGFSVAGLGIVYYFAVHIPSAIPISLVLGSLFGLVFTRFRSPFRDGNIEPLRCLEKSLETLVNAVQVGDTTVSEDIKQILLRVVEQEIERFINNRNMNDAECGRFLEYLSRNEGAVGQAASALLWPQ